MMMISIQQTVAKKLYIKSSENKLYYILWVPDKTALVANTFILHKMPYHKMNYFFTKHVLCRVYSWGVAKKIPTSEG